MLDGFSRALSVPGTEKCSPPPCNVRVPGKLQMLDRVLQNSVDSEPKTEPCNP